MNRNFLWIGVLGIGLLAVAFLGMPMRTVAAPASASASASASTGPTTLTYEIYTGGMHVLDTDLSLEMGAKTYHAALTSATKGFLGALVPWKGSFDTRGMVRPKSLQVRDHKSVSTWKGADDVAVYQYDAEGTFKKLSLIDDGKDKTPKDIDPKLTRGTTDILTATLSMMRAAAATEKCEGKSAIFDSRRRFHLVYKDQGPALLKSTRYGLYAGPAMTCTAEVVPDGGAWHKKPRGWLSIQEQGRKKGTLPTLWLARIDPSLPPVPVKVQIKTDYGTLFMHLARAQVGRTLYQVKK